MENELYHYGVKGMKWGVRRYQNKDGTLTAAGEKRYQRDLREKPLTKEERRNGGRKVNAGKYVKEDLERSRQLMRASLDAVNQLKAANNTASRKRSRKTTTDLSNMSDKEMRDKINRALLERQYNDIFNSKEETKGREYVTNFLDGAGTALALTGSALGVVLSVKELLG